MLRIATIGTSMITEDFVEVVNAHENARFVGSLSRDGERAETFTLERGGFRPFGSLDSLAESDEVDAVYIASPNALHAPQALRCIAGGKHVLIEKPLASNLRETDAVRRAARAAGVVALEAMRPLHDPAYHVCKESMLELGPVRRASIRFGKYSSRYDKIRAGQTTGIFDADMAGGALMDIGVYCVETMVDLFGEPQEITCAPVLLDAASLALTHGRIDGAGVILARYDDLVVSLSYSKITDDLLDTQIEGERATLLIEGISVPVRARLRTRGIAERAAAKTVRARRGATERELALPTSANTMAYELDDFLEAIGQVRSGVAPETARAGAHGTIGHWADITASSIALMDEARRQTNIAFPADGR